MDDLQIEMEGEALIVKCTNTQEVQAAVRTARKNRLPLSVFAAGHDQSAPALRHKGLVIDMSGMRNIEIDPWTQTAIVAGGATASDLISAVARHGLVAVSGAAGTVGDNLLNAQIVLADGSCIMASPSRNPALLWTLKGGGGNFGVVTSLCIRLYPASLPLSGLPKTLAGIAQAGEYPHVLDPGEKDLVAHTFGSNISGLLNMRQQFNSDCNFSASFLRIPR